MSHSIIRKIELDEENQRVIITARSSNVTPAIYHTGESSYFTNIWRHHSREAVDIAIVKAYEEGNFQGGENRWQKASLRLRQFKKYQTNFDWRVMENSAYERIRENRRNLTEEFNALVLLSLKPTT